MAKVKLSECVANAIQGADKRYFFEDYGVQAVAVLAALRSAGFRIVPAQPNEAMIEAGEQAIRSGSVRPADHVRTVYEAMVRGGEVK